ncbi:Pre-mRNA-splicing factor SLU7 [Smittium mucronatum]|uniref:Pre-mRNA-splicing factor SLU7 n=1 Tax=Smittium mucronatum TaxID=133383 RepID=A0A1R0GZ61_9FUNG|nr:Pre-mRNA-splicing factor SLU7 [Smittium mucronatum]
MYSGAPKLSREEYRKQKDLEEARKAGNAPAEVDEEGNDINPHIPQFMSKAPWYVDNNKPGLKHQKNSKLQVKASDSWYSRGSRKSEVSTKFRKGACENCGAMSHKTKDCMERPRKKGAKFTGKNIMPDEIVTQVDFDYDKKRDRWIGYDPKQHLELIEEWDLIEKARKKRKAEELDKAIVSGTVEDIEKQLGSSDDENGDEDKYAERTDMPGQKIDLNSRTTIRNLRIREDTAKYLRNLDLDSAYYDPKTRSMRENPYSGKDPNELPYAGDNFVRASGDAPEITKIQLFAWDAEMRGNSSIHLQANPTQSVLLKKQFESNKKELKSSIKQSILEKYGGKEHLVKPENVNLHQSENYVEYNRYGKVVAGLEAAKKRSRYQEDIYPNNHSSVWGSYWTDGKWGYNCCRQLIKNSYCTSMKKPL